MPMLAGAAAVVPALVEGLFRFLHTMVTTGKVLLVHLNSGAHAVCLMQHCTGSNIAHALSACNKCDKAA